MKRKEQRESSGAGRGGANTGRGGRGASSNRGGRGGGVVARAPVKQIGRSYQQTLQTVSKAEKKGGGRSE